MTFRIGEQAKRLAWERQQVAMRQRSEVLRARLAAKVALEGPESLWAEMLADHDRRHAR